MPEKIQLAEEEFRRLHRQHRHLMERSLESTGVFHSQHRALTYVACHEGCSQKDLAEAHRISTAAVAVHLKKLEKAGLIFRKVDTADNRCNTIFLTPEGKRVAEQSYCIFEAVDHCLFRNFTEEELDEFIFLLQKANRNLAEADRQNNVLEGPNFGKDGLD